MPFNELPPQLCKYGCGVTVIVKKVGEGWRPFTDNGQMHDCPNSEYNKKKRQQEQKEHEELGEGPSIFQQEKNDHGNEFQVGESGPEILFHAKDNSLQFVGTGSQESTVTIKQKRKLVLRRWFTSNNPDVLTIAVNDFVKEKEGRAGQTYAVWRPDIASMEYGECVYYEAEV